MGRRTNQNKYRTKKCPHLVLFSCRRYLRRLLYLLCNLAPYVRRVWRLTFRVALTDRASSCRRPPQSWPPAPATMDGQPPDAMAAAAHGQAATRRRPGHARSSTGRVGHSRPGRAGRSGRSRPGHAGRSRPGRAACLPWRWPASLHAEAAAASQRAPRLDSQERLTVGTDGKIKRTEGSEQTYAEGQKCLFRSQIHVYRD